MKVIILEQTEQLDEVSNEIQILKKCNHINVVRYFGYFERAGKQPGQKQIWVRPPRSTRGGRRGMAPLTRDVAFAAVAARRPDRHGVLQRRLHRGHLQEYARVRLMSCAGTEQRAHAACVPVPGELAMPVLQKPFREEEIAAVLRDALTVRRRSCGGQSVVRKGSAHMPWRSWTSAPSLASLQGLQYLHSINVIHRDVKGGNLLISYDGRVKLGALAAALSAVGRCQRGARLRLTRHAGPRRREAGVGALLSGLWRVGPHVQDYEQAQDGHRQPLLVRPPVTAWQAARWARALTKTGVFGSPAALAVRQDGTRGDFGRGHGHGVQ